MRQKQQKYATSGHSGHDKNSAKNKNHFIRDKIIGPPLLHNGRVCGNYSISTQTLGHVNVLALHKASGEVPRKAPKEGALVHFKPFENITIKEHVTLQSGSCKS